MPSQSSSLIQSCARPLTGDDTDYDALLDLVGDATLVLLGEASHGTDEFYRERMRITQRLIAEKGFVAVAIEADWPDAYRVNRFVRGDSADADADQALAGFQRFPAWMWRNTAMLEFVAWLRRHNDGLAPGTPRAGIYGLDLYSLFSSVAEVLRYLEQVDPPAARRARERYGCFDHFREDSQRYGYSAGLGISASCEDAVVAQLTELHARGAGYLRDDGRHALDALFYAEQNARLVVDAERYYRTMFRGRVASWNLRDLHMMNTLTALERYLETTLSAPARMVVWAHNSHLGDARATEVGEQGELNLGQLVRVSHGNSAVLVGMTTHQGTVTAAAEWDAPAERKRLLAALPGSYESLFHQSGLERFMLSLRDGNAAVRLLNQPRLERAVGVIYLPETERQSHYFHATLARQFDVLLHFDTTSALEPLETGTHWVSDEVPETYPSGV